MKSACLVVLVLVVVLGTSCGMSVDASEVSSDDYGGQPVATSEGELIGTPSTYWPGNPPMIPVCFENPSKLNSGWRSTIRAELERNWQREGRVNFTGWGVCSRGLPGIHVSLGPPGSGMYSRPLGRLLSGLTAGTRSQEGTNFDADGTYFHLHEFGHALGFWHEEERPGYTSSTGEFCTPQSAPALINNANGPSLYYGGYDTDSVMSYCARGRTPQGAPTWLSPNDIAALRRAYGARVDGSLVSPQGNCASNNQVAGERPFLRNCDELVGSQRYSFFTSGSFLRLPGSGLCVSGVDEVPRLVTCDPLPSNGWSFVDTMIRGWGGLCIDLQGGLTANGTPIQMWECGALAGNFQRWNVTTAGELRFSGAPGKCVTVDGSSGGQAFLWDCDGRATQRFSMNPNGRLQLDGTSNCLAVRSFWDSQWTQSTSAASGRPTNGMALQLFSCVSSQTNQAFSFRGPVKNLKTGTCLSRTADAPGGALSFATCGAAGTEWDYYWLLNAP